MANILGYKIEDHDKRKLADIYLELYGIPKNIKWGKETTFKNAKNIFYPLIKKNKTLFKKILKEQLKLSS